ncbi:MAG: DUF4331 domain-containing protein [Acidobacteriota bacterium]|nr:DUF4331 domain-containing protein [Acidobacteriota bacterium]
MRKNLPLRKLLTASAVGALALALLVSAPVQNPSQASSHREAPLITADPLADNTDVYAFRSTEAGREGFVTLISNFIPFQEPSGGPHFYLFDDTVLYEIKIDNTGDGIEDISYQFRFNTHFRNPNTVLGMAAVNQDGVIESNTDPDYNEYQTYTVSRRSNATGKNAQVLASNLVMPPSNVGQRATPNYEAHLASQAVYNLPGGGRVFAGQRDEGFYIDVGGIFDIFNLSALGPPINFETGGFGGTDGFNVNTLAIEVPISALTRDGQVPTSTTAANAVVGVWSTASRRTTRVIRQGRIQSFGPFAQVSRLGNPLVNEVVVPLGLKDTFNSLTPASDAVLAPAVLDPELPKLIQTALSAFEGVQIEIPPAPRTDLVAIFATGIPAGTVPGAPGFTTFLSDGVPHEYLRLNVAIPPSASPNRLGLLGNDPAGFPNGRRVGDDVVDIELRAVLGGTPFTPAFNVFPNNAIGDGVDTNDIPYLTRFPYLATPHSGNIRGTRPHDHHLSRPLPGNVIVP